MATDHYEVLADELTLHRAVGVLKDPISGETTGIQNGRGKTYFKGEVIAASEISPDYIDILEDEDSESYAYVSKRLKKVKGEAYEDVARRLGLPFDGYDDMDEADVLASLRTLPSATVQRIKEYEAQNENRYDIVNYNVGFGESPSDRAVGKVGSRAKAPDTDKEVAKIQTREVHEDGTVTPGEGITGTGDPAVAPGTAAKRREAATPKRKAAARRRRTT